MKRSALLAIVLLGGTGFFFFGAAPVVDGLMNTVVNKPPYTVSAEAAAMHARLRIADMHDDLLAWPRGPLARSTTGSTDIPRLIEGNIALQVFSTVSKSPFGQNYEKTKDNFDNITLLGLGERRPLSNVGSLFERARWTAEKARRAERGSDGALVLVTTHPELQRALDARGLRPKMVIGLLSLEGLQVLEGRLVNVDSLAQWGFRMAGLTHFSDNEVAGSAHGMQKGGLTALGREVVPRMERAHMLVDLAHLSPTAIDEVLRIATRPVVVSHGGVQAVCPGPRNLTDDQLRRIAATGGVIGIGFWDSAVCGTTPGDIAKSIKHAVQIAGIEHVGLGSDWDGAIAAIFDATGTALLTEALMKEGFTEPQITRIMGENVIHLLLTTLPPG